MSSKVWEVHYTYPIAHKPSLDQLNLTINPNTTVGIVGSSGAGKTTLVDILLGLLNIDSGNFRVDGIDITPRNIQAWRNGAGYIPQSIYLTDDTIAANIAFGISKDDVNFEDIIKAGKLAMLDQLRRLPEDTLTVALRLAAFQTLSVCGALNQIVLLWPRLRGTCSMN